MTAELTDTLNTIQQKLDHEHLEDAKSLLDKVKSTSLEPEDKRKIALLESLYHIKINDPDVAMVKIAPVINQVDALPDLVKAETYVTYSHIMLLLDDLMQAQMTVEEFRKLTEHSQTEGIDKIWKLTSEIDNIEGLVEVQKNNYQTASKRFESAINNFRAQKRNNLLGIALFNQGQVTHLIGTDPMPYLKEAIDIFEEAENYSALAAVIDACIEINKIQENKSKIQEYQNLYNSITTEINNSSIFPDHYQFLKNKYKQDRAQQIELEKQLGKEQQSKKAEIAEEVSKIEALEMELKIKDERILHLEQQINDIKQNLDDINQEQDETVELKQRVGKLEADKSVAEAKISGLKASLTDRDNTISQLEKQVEEMEPLSSKNTHQVSELLTQLEKKNARIKKLEQSITSLNDKLLNQKQQDSAMHDILSHRDKLSSEIHELKLLISEKDDLIGQLQDNIKTLKTEVKTKQSMSVGSPAGSEDIVTGVVDDETINSLIKADKVLELVYDRLSELNQSKIKVLAMQLGINNTNCKEAVDKLVEHGILRYDDNDENTVIMVS